MQIKRVLKFIPVPVFIKKLNGVHQAMSFGFFIIITPEAKDDVGLLAHELHHSKRFYKSFGLSGLFTLISKRFRLKEELACYSEQLKYSSDLAHYARSLKKFAFYLATYYNLDISEEEAFSKLSEISNYYYV